MIEQPQSQQVLKEPVTRVVEPLCPAHKCAQRIGRPVTAAEDPADQGIGYVEKHPVQLSAQLKSVPEPRNLHYVEYTCGRGGRGSRQTAEQVSEATGLVESIEDTRPTAPGESRVHPRRTGTARLELSPRHLRIPSPKDHGQRLV